MLLLHRCPRYFPASRFAGFSDPRCSSLSDAVTGSTSQVGHVSPEECCNAKSPDARACIPQIYRHVHAEGRLESGCLRGAVGELQILYIDDVGEQRPVRLVSSNFQQFIDVLYSECTQTSRYTVASI